MNPVTSVDRRTAVRIGIARISLTISLAAGGIAVAMIVAALYSYEFAGDFENGTHDYHGLDALGYVLLTVPLAALFGAVCGRGQCRLACGAILAVVVILVSQPVIAAI